MMPRPTPSGPPTLWARSPPHAAIDALGPGDRAAVVRTSAFDGEGVAQNFTTDRALLHAAVNTPFSGLTPPPSTGPSGGAEGVPNVRDTIDCRCGICVHDAIARIAASLASERQQKTMLFIGSDLQIIEPAKGGPVFDCSLAAKEAREKTLRALDLANVTIHSVDPTGLETNAPTASNRSRQPPIVMLQRHGNLAVLPDYTGGRTVVGTNRPDSIVPEIFEETRSYYLVGFERGTPNAENARREIRVTVNRPSATVRSRRTYYSGSDSTDTDPTAASDRAGLSVSTMLPKADVPLQLALVQSLRADRAHEILVMLRIGATLSVAERFDISITVLDRQGRPVRTERLTADVGPRSRDVEDRPLDAIARVSLTPGSYEIRVGVAGQTSGLSGSVYGTIDLSERPSGAPALSGVLIEAVAATAADAGAAATRRLTLRRTFARTDAPTAFVQVQRGAEDLSVRIQVFDMANKLVAESSERIDDARYSLNGVADVQFALPVSTVRAGRYLLTIEASDARTTVRRNVPFTVQ
jgi:VWFA-related protein